MREQLHEVLNVVRNRFIHALVREHALAGILGRGVGAAEVSLHVTLELEHLIRHSGGKLFKLEALLLLLKDTLAVLVLVQENHLARSAPLLLLAVEATDLKMIAHTGLELEWSGLLLVSDTQAWWIHQILFHLPDVLGEHIFGLNLTVLTSLSEVKPRLVAVRIGEQVHRVEASDWLRVVDHAWLLTLANGVGGFLTSGLLFEIVLIKISAIVFFVAADYIAYQGKCPRRLLQQDLVIIR